MIKLMKEKCFTTEEVRKRLGLSEGMFSYYRYNLRILPPPPIKVGSPDGVVPYYTEPIISLAEKIIGTRKSGLTNKEIQKKCASEIKELFDICDRLKDRFEKYKKIKKDLSKQIGKIESGSGSETLGINVGDDVRAEDSAGGNVQDTAQGILEELKEDFRSCDFSMDSLMKVKQKIVKLEEAQSLDEVTKVVQSEWNEINSRSKDKGK